MSEHDVPDAVTKVARDLSEILNLAADLETQAVHKANDPLMPGGLSMVALAAVANLEAWQNVVDTDLRIAYENGVTAPELDDEDDWEPPLQTLCFWSEQWRVEHNRESDRRPTLTSEAGFIRQMLNWAWENETHFKDFADDIRKAKARLENLLQAGQRTQRGVQCFDCSVDLVRISRDRRTLHYCDGHDGTCTIPHRFCPHDRGGLVDEWKCPSCDRSYDLESYRRAVSHAHFVYADFLPLREAMERTGATRGSVQGWASKGQVTRRKDHETGRVLYRVADIENQMGATEGVAS